MKNILSILLMLIIVGCGSENSPVAENFIGKWQIYQKVQDRTQDTDVDGEMDINFGNEVISFSFNVTAGTITKTQAGIVYNDILYADSSHRTAVGRVELAGNILLIWFDDDPSAVYYAAGT